jgi:glycosyltransferase involved in cell wall biosynthesis
MLCPQLGYGGAEKSFTRLANFLNRHHDVTVALFARSFGGSYDTGGAEALEPPVTLLSPEGLGRLRAWPARWRALRALKEESDVAISFLSGPNLLNALTAPATPTVISVRGSRRYETEGSFLHKLIWKGLLDRIAYRRADCIVTASGGLAHEVREALPPGSGEVVAIEGTVDARALVAAGDEPIEPAFEALARYPTIIACGRAHEQKGFQHLIPIFAAVRRQQPAAKLLILGDGPELAALEERAERLGQRTTRHVGEAEVKDIIFAGFRERPIRYFRVGRLFAFTSLYEGLPNALIEAVASGLPVFAADCPWGARSVLSGEAGAARLTPEESLPQAWPAGTLMPRLGSETAAAAWTETLVAALRNAPTRRTSAERLATIARFDMEHSGQTWLSLVDELSRRKGTPA